MFSFKKKGIWLLKALVSIINFSQNHLTEVMSEGELKEVEKHKKIYTEILKRVDK